MSTAPLEDNPLSIHARPKSVVYDCPWCETRVTDLHPYVSPELRYFEQHLDVHVARGDHLRVVPVEAQSAHQSTSHAAVGASEQEQPVTGRAVGARPVTGKAA